MSSDQFAKLKLELQLKTQKGIDFLLAASIVWLIITFIWTLDYSAYNKSVLTFMVGALLLPLALAFSKVFRTQWKIPENPLQPLGLWLNVAQLLYFPFLVFILLRYPDYFVMTYAIITGAHFFPYAWLYDEMGYGLSAVIISVGALLLTLNTTTEQAYLIPLFTAVSLLLFSAWIFTANQKLKARETTAINEK